MIDDDEAVSRLGLEECLRTSQKTPAFLMRMGRQFARALYRSESLFLARSAYRHAYLGPPRVSCALRRDLWRYAGANAAIFVQFW